MSKLNLQDDNKCFACGLDNMEGLRLQWTLEELSMSTFFKAEGKYQSWKGIVHGGILATLLDESMARLACVIYAQAVTAEMTVRYVLPAQIGEVLFVKGEVVKDSRRLLEMKATLYRGNESGVVIAYATGKIMKVL